MPEPGAIAPVSTPEAGTETPADTEEEKPSETPQVVSLDAFRRRTPPKT
jgi:hypothetical protein